MTISNEAVEAAGLAVAKEMRQRTYDRHAYNNEVFLEGVADIALAALEAAAPLIQAEALEDAADDCYGDVMGQATATWLRYRASRLRQL